MEWTKVKTEWPTISKKVHKNWDKLSESDLKTIGGRRDELVKSLESHYSMDKKKAETAADEFVKKLT